MLTSLLFSLSWIFRTLTAFLLPRLLKTAYILVLKAFFWGEGEEGVLSVKSNVLLELNLCSALLVTNLAIALRALRAL
jgi:hypothetical protein